MESAIQSQYVWLPGTRRFMDACRAALVREEGKLNPWTAGLAELQAALEPADQVPVPQQDSWRVLYLEKLLAMRLQAY